MPYFPVLFPQSVNEQQCTFTSFSKVIQSEHQCASALISLRTVSGRKNKPLLHLYSLQFHMPSVISDVLIMTLS